MSAMLKAEQDLLSQISKHSTSLKRHQRLGNIARYKLATCMQEYLRDFQTEIDESEMIFTAVICNQHAKKKSAEARKRAKELKEAVAAKALARSSPKPTVVRQLAKSTVFHSRHVRQR